MCLCWSVMVISALVDEKQEDHQNFKARMVYRASSQAARSTLKGSVSKINKNRTVLMNKSGGTPYTFAV